jgi:signal transduction histidine kinase
MNPSATLRRRRITAMLFAGWALLAIGLSLGALVLPGDDLGPPFETFVASGVAEIEEVSPGAAAAGIAPGDRLLSVDGKGALSVLRWGFGHLRPHVANVYEVEKPDGRVLTVALEPVPPSPSRSRMATLAHASLLLVALFYFGIGGVVWFARPDRAESWAFALFCSTISVELATAVRPELIPWAGPRLLVNLPLLGAATFHLFTTWPLEPDWVVRSRRIQLAPYAVGLVIGLLGALHEPLGIPMRAAAGMAFFYGSGLCLLSLGVLAIQRRRAREAGLGDRADIMFVAGVVSFLPAILVLIAEFFLQVPFPPWLPLLWLFFFPIAVGYGIVRRTPMEFRLVAKSSAAHGAASLAITGVFALVIAFADLVVSRFNVDARSPWFQVTFVFLAILAFNPVRNRMQSLVDRVFDRDRARYRLAVREISEAMVSMLSLAEIGDRILVALTDTMGVERAMVLLFDEQNKVLSPSAWRGDWDEADLGIEIPSEHPIWRQLWMRREELSRIDFDDEPDPENREQCRDIFDTLEVELLVPILFGVDLLGVIAVGRKHSGERLAGDDRQLLRTLANQSSIAIENAKAFDEIAKLNETLEARVEERTRELRVTQEQLLQSEKMKSLGQLVAGVAHELNNPIGFVHANLQLLEEYIRKLVEGGRTESDTDRVREAISKLLSRSREGTERVKKIVQDLRTFSRMDQAELQVADLHEEIDRTLALMEPRFKGGIEVARRYGDIPRVRCYPGQLNQVFLNLLMNACDAMGAQGTITINTYPIDGGVRLEFSDTGPGIPPDVQSRIFDPFFTTKPVGVGTGLGLSLTHGIIERHGGRIYVRSKLGEGATFVIDLPLEASPPEE